MQTEELKNTTIPFPVTFVCRSKERWSDLFLGSDSIESIPDPDRIPGKIVSNEDCWILLTYLHLKRRNLNVYLCVRFQINGLPKNRPVEWHDYSEADLVLAVRDLTQKDALVKPASKLVNAWIAGVPALLGPEPAFQKLMQSHLDYIEVATPQAALDAIRKLKHDPNLYRAMILNGQKRAEAFSTVQIAQKWQQALAQPIAELYSKWCKRSSISKISGFALRTVSQKIAQAQANYHRTHGYRPVSNTRT